MLNTFLPVTTQAKEFNLKVKKKKKLKLKIAYYTLLHYSFLGALHRSLTIVLICEITSDSIHYTKFIVFVKSK